MDSHGISKCYDVSWWGCRCYYYLICVTCNMYDYSSSVMYCIVLLCYHDTIYLIYLLPCQCYNQINSVHFDVN